MYAFNYTRAGSVAEAVAALAKSDNAKLLAGGQTLLPTMKQRLASPAEIIDLSHAADLKGIARSGDKIVIGAMTTHCDVATNAAVREAIPALADLADGIGDPQVRNRGTIGGSVANNDPAADYPAACLALGATIITNKREIAAADYFKGLFETALEDGEVITKVAFPIPAKAAYQKFPNPASRYALVGVFVAKTAQGVRVAVTGAGASGVFRAEALEQALSGNFSADALAGANVSSDGLNSDIHADADYRAHLIGVLTKRAVAAMG
ncbi:FAD binding domain-containing protein [Methylovirgula sp. 4M-Z18]|uniref:FAD binding domain-containing protein n=1 Tax=Methylovirgula sp. 4M-Z18 TaxID=2293567 RepID=UPI000E2F8596|nr:xanthine dehydrogenase family protein subunit M [Methylovirgula sp. 4M-Z18]RFB78971.1 xanthine dehydrogenase family protein subunit M [Methylovirgula sp. 4M-Z18]